MSSALRAGAGIGRKRGEQKKMQLSEENTTSDCISRQAAIDALEKVAELYPWRVPGDRDSYSHYNEGWNDAIGRAEIALEELPSAQPAQQWIPCKTRLPEELEEVNVTWINHSPESYYDFVKGKPFTGSAVYYKEKWYWYSSTCTDILGEYGENDIDEVDDAIEITAWKPIGEPWKGEQK